MKNNKILQLIKKQFPRTKKIKLYRDYEPCDNYRKKISL